MTLRTGKCLCGSVTVTSRGAVTTTDACHCVMCRRQNGGGAFHGAHFTEGATFSGETVRWFASSEWGERGFCSKCGTTLAWRLKDKPEQPSVAVGLFDDFDAPMQAHIFVDEGPSYTTIPTDAPHKTGAQVLAEFEASQAEADS